MIHPHTKVLDLGDERGSGILATQLIPKGTLVWVPSEVDQVLSVEQVSAMPKSEQEFLAEYAYLTNEGNYIISWDHERYVNHSCDSNSMSVGGTEIKIAVRDILPDDEITDDYGFYRADDDLDCRCGSLKCRHKVRKDDILRYGDEWDRLTAAAFHLIPKVEQPLWAAISSQDMAYIEAILAGKTELSSCKVLNCSLKQLEKARELLWPSLDNG